MPYIIFKFKCGDTVYAKQPSPEKYCNPPVYHKLTILSFLYKNTKQYYRLSNNTITAEIDLLNQSEYENTIQENNEQSSICLQNELNKL